MLKLKKRVEKERDCGGKAEQEDSISIAAGACFPLLTSVLSPYSCVPDFHVILTYLLRQLLLHPFVTYRSLLSLSLSLVRCKKPIPIPRNVAP
ncbi:hypothetical protein VNO77_11210 [Canavalia gladiata]|uniref:Uncharacterized protein n=1 Tax=Canavalia gladiata TaxID=3824 RepID=A0AAN9MCN2_CANGL